MYRTNSKDARERHVILTCDVTSIKRTDELISRQLRNFGLGSVVILCKGVGIVSCVFNLLCFVIMLSILNEVK
jgi:hypothetical protein